MRDWRTNREWGVEYTDPYHPSYRISYDQVLCMLLEFAKAGDDVLTTFSPTCPPRRQDNWRESVITKGVTQSSIKDLGKEVEIYLATLGQDSRAYQKIKQWREELVRRIQMQQRALVVHDQMGAALRTQERALSARYNPNTPKSAMDLKLCVASAEVIQLYMQRFAQPYRTCLQPH